MKIAKVEPITTARALRGPFDYRIPEGMEVEVGSLLVVPFARRKLLGVVTGLAGHSDLAPERLAEPLEVLETATTAELIELGGWVADRYASARSRGIALGLPPGAGTGKRPRTSKARTERFSNLLPAGASALDGEGEGARLGAKQLAALGALRERGELSDRELATLTGAGGQVVARLAERGLIETSRRAVRRRPALPAVGDTTRHIKLSPAQRAAADAAIASLDGDGPSELLLHGVTGSGKTEVYLEAIEATLERGRTAVLLVPEIGLTPQTMGRVAARLGDRVAVIHSGLSEGERGDEWRRLRSGEARVCVGPRSAVFAPLDRPGLIIVDEEHDSSYKQEGDPRYDARAVARRRAEMAGGVYLAGSATPRPESWNELARIELPERVDSRPMPGVELLDMREQGPRAGPLHPAVRNALLNLAPDEKAIVMLNRRGFAPHLSCASCGEAIGCPHCDVSLVMHRGSGRMVCHHCSHVEPIPSECPSCKSVAMARAGAGTERIEALVSELVDPHPVIRLDADTTSQKGSHGRLLSEFGAARGGVLVGTQMVAKGHDFADVVLSVLLDADSTLRYPDFRAEERTFALVSQLAGRSGRGARGGRVLVQTLAPEAEPMLAASRHDTPGFVKGELDRRREFAYPPFSSLVAIELAGSGERELAVAADRVAAAVAPLLPADAELLGPAPRFRRRGRYRRRMLIKSQQPEAVTAAISGGLEQLTGARELRNVALAVDVDPQ